MLRTKSIFAPIVRTDGLRISVMSRHTKNDGHTPDERITPATYDEWWRPVAPTSKWVGQWYGKAIDWRFFEEQYLWKLRRYDVAGFVKILAELALYTNITLLCAEETPEHCHRRLLAEECGRLVRGLTILHLDSDNREIGSVNGHHI